MTKDEIIRKKQEYIFNCVTTYFKDPLVIDHAKGQYVWDLDGKQYLDFLGGIVTISVGHSNEKVTAKIKEQIDRVQHTSTLFPTEAIVALAEKVAQIAPGKLKKSYFTNSGTEANEVAVLTARMYTGNYELLALRHGYSGHSQLTKSLTGLHTWRKAGVIPYGIVHAPGPYCYRCPYGLTYPSCDLHCAKDIEEVIKTSTSGADRRDACGNDPRFGRIHRSAAGLFQDCRQHRAQLRRAFHCRRSSGGVGPHRKEMVGHRALGSGAGHHHLRKGHGQRRAHRLDAHPPGNRRRL